MADQRGPRSVLAGIRRLTGGRGSAVEVGSRSMRNLVRFYSGRSVVRRDLYSFRNPGAGRFGVYGLGGCDVRTIVGAGPLLARRIEGTGCLGVFSKVAETRSDLLLQAVEPPPPAHTAEVVERLDLAADYFSPRLIQPTFTVPDQAGLGRFPKSVVVLSISSDVSRTLYRHREHGFLVDPGGWWLSADMQEVLRDPDIVKWFAKTFTKVGRISTDDFVANFERMIRLIREHTGAFVVVLNVLTVDPGMVALDYKFANSPNRIRRREFAIAITELAGRLDFPVLDVDRLAKQAGISGQVDFVHYTQEQKHLISSDFVSILADHSVIGPPRQGRAAAQR